MLALTLGVGAPCLPGVFGHYANECWGVYAALPRETRRLGLGMCDAVPASADFFGVAIVHARGIRPEGRSIRSLCRTPRLCAPTSRARFSAASRVRSGRGRAAQPPCGNACRGRVHDRSAVARYGTQLVREHPHSRLHPRSALRQLRISLRRSRGLFVKRIRMRANRGGDPRPVQPRLCRMNMMEPLRGGSTPLSKTKVRPTMMVGPATRRREFRRGSESYFPVVDLQVNLVHYYAPCRVLGPGTRGVVWVRGCSMRCRGCIAGPVLESHPETLIPVAELVGQVLSREDLDGLTLSGGEPFDQAEALAELCERLKSRRDVSLMSFSGYSRSQLATGSSAQRRLLGLLDVLVDGPFVQSEQADLLWRGSRNQRVHLLTTRHADWDNRLEGPGQGIELVVGQEGSFFWMGVPPPDFERRLRVSLAASGVALTDVGDVHG